MSVIHYEMGDYICNCACQVCLSGSCCRFSQTPGVLTTTTTIGAGPSTVCNPTDHDFGAVVMPSSGDARLYCRKCGVTRKVK